MNRRVGLLLLGFVVAGVMLGLVIWATRSGARSSGALRQEVYVWQRAWIPPVREAVARRATNFSNLVALRAEVSWKAGQPRLARATVDYETLAKAGRPAGIALRIGPFSGPFASDHPITRFLADTAAGLVADAQTNQFPLSELQIDFDCAESKLDGYRVWVEAIQRRVAPLPVTITALPSWLDARAFKRLAAVATNYVLQVHSVARPRSFSAPFTLCDPRAASRAVEQAGRLGVPFRVALPTYGYLLAFDAAGKFLGLSAEGPRPNWPAKAQIREVASDPNELATLVRSWTDNRPAAMRGVIWYRLPTAVDNFNWRWPTLEAMLAARVPREVLRASACRVESGLMEISLVNDGELDNSSRLAVEVRWRDARLMAGDALRDFELAESSSSAARFQTKSQPSRLRAGEALVLGWLRFDRDCEVRCEIIQP